MQHGENAALRGVPSLVWRAGQDRRLNMVRQWAPLDGARALVDGCGVGMYVRALQQTGAYVWGLDIEHEHAALAAQVAPGAGVCQSAGESLPFRDERFDLVLSHEVIEHVQDDRLYAKEMMRVLRRGGRAIVFCPNRLYPFETHGHYWRGEYHFGNTPLINWLPDPARDRLAPHVRAYTRRGLRSLFDALPARIVHHTVIYPGYDNIARRQPELGRLIRRVTYALEESPLRWLGLSHFLVVEKL
ncbi:MAG: class I SAM-dependent methyltransferase [Anaerolineae bacterium]|nr:class I SAM-dependent methyltransferase [Anaerolineae bacterium]MCB9132958.1 class I SAM-dependent methyltransferase [Anaerolineales bacterium]MCB0242679.1 class I SAM-dependent methyltransferase [Anaerolineae bacterium]MCB0248710.1 class I SAM-dependent methyltransferase [Anaerolineae bacterium]MCB9142454.1 class I SAM-dependent methyltransferase [Anaerolineales bacterium]